MQRLRLNTRQLGFVGALIGVLGFGGDFLSGWAGRARAATAGEAEVARSDAAGRVLAEMARKSRPIQSATNQAVLKMRDTEGRRRSLPLTITARVEEDRWQVQYRAQVEGRQVQLSILHREDQAPIYEWSERAADQSMASAPRALTGAEVYRSFAGTDFGVSDLGLAFLFWPHQRLVRSEPHSGVMCRVLESKPSSAEGYSRVVSWIEPEHHALLGAEAYDAEGRVLKRFSIGALSRSGVKDLKIRDLKKDSLTELVYSSIPSGTASPGPSPLPGGNAPRGGASGTGKE